MGSEFSAPHEAAAASGEASPEQIVVPPSALHQRQERAATWHHRGQQQRMYEHTPWPRSANGPSTQHSDSESEASFDHNSGPPSSLSRTSSSARLKRSFSQHSDCSDIGTCTPDEAGASLTNDDPDASSSGTWPRLPKRSSRSRMAAHDALDVWELTRALAREKSDLADQLARMTAQETDVASPYPPRPLSATVATAEHANHSLPIFDSIGRPTCKSFDARIAELDNLVAAEQVHHHQQIDDRTLNSILGALQDQFKPDGEAGEAPSAAISPCPAEVGDDGSTSSLQRNTGCPPPAYQEPSSFPRPAHWDYGYPTHARLVHLAQLQQPRHHVYYPHLQPAGQLRHEYHAQDRRPEYPLAPCPAPLPGCCPPRPAAEYSPAPPPPSSAAAYEQQQRLGGYRRASSTARRATSGGPISCGLPSLPASIAGPGVEHELLPPPPPLPRESLHPLSHSPSGAVDPASIALGVGDEDSPLLLSAEQLCMYEGLFDDVDFLSHVEGSVNVHSPRISAALGSLSVPGVGPLSPVLESQPGASPSGSDRDVFADTGPSTTLPNGKLAVALPLGPRPHAVGDAGSTDSARLPHQLPAAVCEMKEPTQHGRLTARAISSRTQGWSSSPGCAAPCPSLTVDGTAFLPPLDAESPPVERDIASSGSIHRKEWALSEDELILECVRTLGCKWRQIAAMLPGRSDDAVRNRWNRLKDPAHLSVSLLDSSVPGAATAYRCSKCGQFKKNHRCTWMPPAECLTPATPAPRPDRSVEVCSAAAATDADDDDKRKPERISWKPEEDEMITRSVAEIGHKWFQIAERLPGRTDHAIRNRWHRLLTMQLDAVIRRKKSGSGISGPVSDEEELELSFCNERLQAELDALSRDPLAALDLGALVADPAEKSENSNL